MISDWAGPRRFSSGTLANDPRRSGDTRRSRDPRPPEDQTIPDDPGRSLRIIFVAIVLLSAGADRPDTEGGGQGFRDGPANAAIVVCGDAGSRGGPGQQINWDRPSRKSIGVGPAENGLGLAQ